MSEYGGSKLDSMERRTPQDSLTIQASPASVPAVPPWFGEVVLLTAHLRKHGVLTKINEGVRFARRRFGRYEGAT